MKALGRLIWIIGCWLIALTCVGQQRYAYLDFPRAAQWPLGNEPLSLLLVNNTIPQPGDAPGLREAALWTLVGAQRTLVDEGLYEVQLLEQTQTTGSFLGHLRLSPAAADSLRTRYGADIVIALHQELIYDNCCATQWHIYAPGADAPAIYAATDTLLWQQLSELALYAGEASAQRMLPTYVSEVRYLYEADEPALQAGLDAFTHRRWDEAFRRWEELYTRLTAAHSLRTMKRQPLRDAAYAAANAAVALEVMGLPDEAEQWAIRAEQVFQVWSERTLPGAAQARQQVVNIRYYRGQIQK